MSNSIWPGIPPYQQEVSILGDPYHKEVQEDIWQHERKKTMYALLTIGFVLLVSNVIGYARANALELANLLEIILIPAIFIGLGFFALLQPLFAAIAGILVIVALTIINLIAVGPISLLAGAIFKVVALYFIIPA
jgi:hypothetical protein